VHFCFACCFLWSALHLQAQQLYEMESNVQTRLSSFEKPNGVKGNGGKTNKTAKENAFDMVQPGETKMLARLFKVK